MRRRELIVGAPLSLAAARFALAGTPVSKIRVRSTGVSIGLPGAELTRDARPYLAWRYVGESDWRSTLAESLVVGGAGAGLALHAQLADCRAHVTIAPAGTNEWRLSSTLVHTGRRPIELARFHLLDGRLEDPLRGLLVLQGLTTQRLVKTGEKLAPFATAFVDLWASMRVRWTGFSDPVYGASDWALSKDLGCFAADWRADVWGAAFTGPGLAFGEIGFRTNGGRGFFIGQVLDNILLEPGETRPMDAALIWYGDWQNGVKRWMGACAREFSVPQPTPAPVGYCSWYQRGQTVELADIQRATREYSAWAVPPGGRLIQIDDGYQVMPGNWQPNAKFVDHWRELPAEIARGGSIPGTYLAPMTIHESHPLVRSQPQMLQRLPDGSPPISFANWGGNTYYVDPDHPLARDFMRKFFVDARHEGWKYVKIDFTYPISIARVAYDRKLTSFQSQRRLYQLFREAAGPDLRLNACIGEPGRYVLGLVDAARIGGDISAKWQTVKDNLINVLLFAPTNGLWWQADPDVFYMRGEGSGLSAEESFVLTGTLGLLGGLFLSSDFPSQWSSDAAARVREFWNPAGPVAPTDQRIVVTPEGQMQAYRVSYPHGSGLRHRMALYNWGDEPRSFEVSLAEAGIPGIAWQLADTVYGHGLRLVRGAIASEGQPPRSLRIADLAIEQARA